MKTTLKACPSITKRELMSALMDGRTFCINHESVKHLTIHWDNNHGNSPVRQGLEPWDWRGFKNLCEIIETHWYDNIPEKGVLCWVSDFRSAERDTIFTITHYKHDAVLRFIGDVDWEFATPVTIDDIYQGEV